MPCNALCTVALVVVATLCGSSQAQAAGLEADMASSPRQPVLRGGAVSERAHEQTDKARQLSRTAQSVSPAPEHPSLEPCVDDVLAGCWGGEQGAGSTFVQPWWVSHSNIYWRCANPGHIALTFDDGPIVATTKAILDELARLEVVATFFVLGTLIEESPELRPLLTRAEANGHVIGHHSYSHPSFLGKAKNTSAGKWTAESLKFFGDEIQKSIDVTRASLPRAGLRPFFRPPYLDIDEAGATLLGEEYGLFVTQVTLDMKDYEASATKESISNRLVENLSPNVSAHSYITLQHDTVPATADALEAMVKGAHELGYKFVGMDECLGLPRLLEPNFRWAPSAPARCSGQPCPGRAACRSEWGFCGEGEAFCNDRAQWQPSCQAPHAEPKSARSNRTLLIVAISIAVLLFLPLVLLLMRKRGRRTGV